MIYFVFGDGSVHCPFIPPLILPKQSPISTLKYIKIYIVHIYKRKTKVEKYIALNWNPYLLF